MSTLFGDIFGDTLSFSREQIERREPEKPYFAHSLFTCEHTVLGSNPTVSTSAKPCIIDDMRLFFFFFGDILVTLRATLSNFEQLMECNYFFNNYCDYFNN